MYNNILRVSSRRVGKIKHPSEVLTQLPGSIDGEINEGYKVCFMTDT